MIRKNGHRFSATIMLHQKFRARLRFDLKPSRSSASIPDRRHGRRYSMPRAAYALLAVAALLGMLEGCGGFAATNEEVPTTGPDLSYRETVAAHLRKVFKNSSTYDSFEISDPRWVHSIKGWNWLTCVRFQDRGHLRTYAVFLSGDKVVDDRFAVQTDTCDLQTYSPFERMGTSPSGIGGGLAPLH
jgi:hypothetical protein